MLGDQTKIFLKSALRYESNEIKNLNNNAIKEYLTNLDDEGLNDNFQIILEDLEIEDKFKRISFKKYPEIKAKLLPLIIRGIQCINRTTK